MVLTSSEDKVERRSVRSFTSPEVIPDDKKSSSTTVNTAGLESEKDVTAIQVVEIQSNASNSPPKTFAQSLRDFFSFDGMRRSGAVLIKLARFTGPGTLISVAYVDPDNFQTAIDAGAQFQYKLLVIVLLGVLMAIYLQALATKLGCVTGLNLAQMNRAHLPRWVNIVLYLIAEAAIISTDIGQVIGTAIAIHIIVPQIPLVGGCAISVTDTLFILMFYKADGTLRRLRLFEMFVSVFIIGVFVSFCIELSLITEPVGEVFRGYLPSKELFHGSGLFQSCAILGGILMPHSLYLGSGLVQTRMREFDTNAGVCHTALASDSKYAINLYRPTLTAIKECMSYSIAEICISLFVITLFINSAILIVAASSLNTSASNADLPGVYALFVSTIGQASGTIFAFALLFSGISAGIVCTMAGQLICEGAMDWRMRPFFRRLLTRTVSIIPAVIIAASEGQTGLAAALNGCNVVLSVALIFLTFPLIWYTCSDRYMRVNINDRDEPLGVLDGVLNHDTNRALRDVEGYAERTVSLANNWATTVGAWVIWTVVAAFNVATLVFLALGIGSES